LDIRFLKAFVIPRRRFRQLIARGLAESWISALVFSLSASPRCERGQNQVR
jgi:hypothetical protein